MELHAIVIQTASGVIADPVISLSGMVGEEPNVVPRLTRIDLLGGRLVLVFRTGTLIPFTLRESFGSIPLDPLTHFIVYYSRLNYNILYPSFKEGFPVGVTPEDKVTFMVGRLVGVETEELVRGKREVYIHHEVQPVEITLMRNDLEEFLGKWNWTVHLAITYYLIGCENIRYFLIEFHKSAEVIRNFFKGEREMLGQLKPYGFTSADYKKLRRFCNDALNPIDIARHAPKNGSNPMRFINLRHLLTEPFSREVWTESSRITRKTIDAYLSYLFGRTFSSEVV